MALTCHLRQELCPSERASSSSLDLADSSFHFRGRDCKEAAAVRGHQAGIGIPFGVISPVPLESSPGKEPASPDMFP